METRKIIIDIPVFPEHRTYMLAALIDPQDNVQVLELDPDDMIRADALFAPCPDCGQTILVSHWSDGEFCAKCARPERFIEEMSSWLNNEFNCNYFLSPDLDAGPFAILVFLDECNIELAKSTLNGNWGAAFKFEIQAPNLITVWLK